MKTIKEWLETIEDQEVREKAIKNWEVQGKDEFESGNVDEAVGSAFLWHETPEGVDYWAEVKLD